MWGNAHQCLSPMRRHLVSLLSPILSLHVTDQMYQSPLAFIQLKRGQAAQLAIMPLTRDHVAHQQTTSEANFPKHGSVRLQKNV